MALEREMGFYLEIRIESILSPDEFQKRVILPISESLNREGLGRILDPAPEDSEVDGVRELALEVSDLDRARKLVDEVIKSVDAQ
jgi:hypothetical protein